MSRGSGILVLLDNGSVTMRTGQGNGHFGKTSGAAFSEDKGRAAAWVDRGGEGAAA